MGRLYQKTVSGERTLAYFESGRVRSGKKTTAIIIYYDGVGKIYQRFQDSDDYTVAYCDSGGSIRKDNGLFGSVYAKCEDGVIYKGSNAEGRVLAYFDGDMYGAAAAAAVTVLKLGKARNSPAFIESG